VRGISPKENEVFEPSVHLRRLVCHTHYKPDSWVGEENSWRVCIYTISYCDYIIYVIGRRGRVVLSLGFMQTRAELCSLYEYRVMLLVRELVSIIALPFFLLFAMGSDARCGKHLSKTAPTPFNWLGVAALRHF
jgi:hypothetical protein